MADSRKKSSLREIRRLLRRASAVGEDFGVVYENADRDQNDRRIHNLTISWLEPDDEAFVYEGV